jgi:hypothetical protein
MQRIEIKNKRVLDILDDVRYNYTEKYDIKTICKQTGYNDEWEWYTSDKYRDMIINSGEKHDGGAERGFAWFLKPAHLREEFSEELREQYKRDWVRIDRTMKTELGLQSGALLFYYPPKGYIDWHNNANAAAFNLIFTYSENGDGWFRYYDLEKGENVTMQDPKGWSLKAGYFGSYKEPDKLVYHCAYTDCDRLTMSYVLGNSEHYWKDCIDYISEE